MGKRKEHHEEHPDERWLITYADVLTLMYVLFMVLFSISVVNTSKFEQLKESLSTAFAGNVADGGAGLLDGQSITPTPPIVDGIPQTIAPEIPSITGPPSLLDASPAQALETSQLEAVEERIDERIEAAGLSGSVETTVNERGLGIRVLTDDLLFGSGAATLTSGAPAILGPVGSGIKELQNPIRVEGHTDSNPISTAAFPSNWELSGARASAVVRYLSGRGIATTRFQAVGFADTRPIGSNATLSGRAANRRVEIIVLRQQGAPDQSPAEALGGTP
jgi:chemotaxis protein MotB